MPHTPDPKGFPKPLGSLVLDIKEDRTMKITFLGIGKVGSALADNLTRARGRGPAFVWAMLTR